jgi:pimeloyl-ACP methyl ester carboxylesterase
MKTKRDKRAGAIRCPKVHAVPALARLPAAIAGDKAFRLFCTPELSQHRTRDHHELTERARFHLRHARWERVSTLGGEVQAYVFEPDEAPRGSALLVHGWTSEAAFMTAFIEPLRRSGLRVVLFDFPAHGQSPGRRTNLAECARAMLGVAEHYGPIDAVVAHSFGGFVSLLVAEGGAPLPRSHPIKRFVLIACPNRLGDVTRDFGRRLGLSPRAQRFYERHLERVGHRPVATFSAVELLRKAGVPALVVHGCEDREVPFRNAEEIAKACPTARLVPFEGFGHRTILYAPPVMRAVMKELAPGPTARDAIPSRRKPARAPAERETNASRKSGQRRTA